MVYTGLLPSGPHAPPLVRIRNEYGAVVPAAQGVTLAVAVSVDPDAESVTTGAVGEPIGISVLATTLGLDIAPAVVRSSQRVRTCM